MTPPLITSLPIPDKIISFHLLKNKKRRLISSISLLLHPLIYMNVFDEFDKILQMPPSEREPEVVRYYAKMCYEWYQILTTYLQKTPPSIRKKLPFFERILWNRIENKYIGEIEWYIECFADILNPDEQVKHNLETIQNMMENEKGVKCNS